MYHQTLQLVIVHSVAGRPNWRQTYELESHSDIKWFTWKSDITVVFLAPSICETSDTTAPLLAKEAHWSSKQSGALARITLQQHQRLVYILLYFLAMIVVILRQPVNLKSIAKGTTDPRVEYQSNLFRSYQKFKHKSWSNMFFRISTKHQLQNLNQTSASRLNLNLKSWPNLAS